MGPRSEMSTGNFSPAACTGLFTLEELPCSHRHLLCQAFGLLHDQDDRRLLAVWGVVVLGEQAADLAPQQRPHLFLLVPVDARVGPYHLDQLLGYALSDLVA